jgi:hypothetical protein
MSETTSPTSTGPEPAGTPAPDRWELAPEPNLVQARRADADYKAGSLEQAKDRVADLLRVNDDLRWSLARYRGTPELRTAARTVVDAPTAVDRTSAVDRLSRALEAVERDPEVTEPDLNRAVVVAARRVHERYRNGAARDIPREHWTELSRALRDYDRHVMAANQEVEA